MSIQPPAGYKFIKYAKSDGSATVELPFGFAKTDELSTYAATNGIHGTDKFLFASKNWNTNNNRFAIVGGYLVNVYGFGVGYGQNPTSMTHFYPYYYSILFHLWSYKNYTFGIEDKNYHLDVSAISFGAETDPIIMFYGYNAPTPGKIAYYKHKKANGTVYNIVPIQHKITGVVEMYDTFSKTIMTRTGTLYPPAD